MSLDLVATKLIPPQPRADFVSRLRLVHRVANPKRGRITLITAPAGYGKTTLLAEWCVALKKSSALHKTRIAWASLDEGDNDSALFWRYIAEALGVPLSAARSPQVNPLINTLASSRESMTLILDDLHTIHSKTILQDLAQFIEHAPQNVSIVLASRSEPDLPLARWRARGQLNELHARHLAFTLAEVRAFLQTTMQLDIPLETAARLETLTEGWAAALQLAALSVQNDGALVNDAVARAHVFEYFADEVFARQSKKLQTFLLQTSILERFSIELANVVTQRTDGAKLLNRLVRANLFVSAFPAEQTWYRYHPLFAEFLQKRLVQNRSLDAQELRQRAAHWFAEHKLFTEAIHHALQAQDFQNASTWIDYACMGAMERGQLETMLRWLEALPASVVRSNPSLNVWCGWVLCLQERFEDMRSHLRDAETQVRRLAGRSKFWRCEAELVQGKSAAIRTQAALLQNDDTQVLHWSRRAMQLLPSRLHNERSAVWQNRAQMLERMGKLEQAHNAYTEAVREARLGKHPFLYIGALQSQAHLFWQQGQARDAERLLRRALKFAQEQDVAELAEPAQHLLDEIARGGTPPTRDALSAREREILEWLARGETNPQIAARLNVGVGTVNWHTKNIYRKLGVRNRTEAAARARVLTP